ncbi:hypothetical protein GCM10009718_03130 [Isoptericola halotolerans]|uniref:Lipoprotein n=1 Tax=Isoptericola halotolerans TaxID=300560 RepID=A0ABX2A1N4_9MICO|nr:hypothetical protein [Isoptericola halotolerans]NOV96762.1 hypothetical protein [Isoptericola halotolerans]
MRAHHVSPAGARIARTATAVALAATIGLLTSACLHDGSAQSGHGAPVADEPSDPAQEPSVPLEAAPTTEAAVAALEHHLALEQEVYRTGDATELDQMAAETCETCRVRCQLALDAHAAGFEVVAGRARVELVRRVPAEEVVPAEQLDPELDRDIYLLHTRVHNTETTLRTPHGTDSHPAAEHGLVATLVAGAEGSWHVGDLTETL